MQPTHLGGFLKNEYVERKVIFQYFHFMKQKIFRV